MHIAHGHIDMMSCYFTALMFSQQLLSNYRESYWMLRMYARLWLIQRTLNRICCSNKWTGYSIGQPIQTPGLPRTAWVWCTPESFMQFVVHIRLSGAIEQNLIVCASETNRYRTLNSHRSIFTTDKNDGNLLKYFRLLCFTSPCFRRYVNAVIRVSQ